MYMLWPPFLGISRRQARDCVEAHAQEEESCSVGAIRQNSRHLLVHVTAWIHSSGGLPSAGVLFADPKAVVKEERVAFVIVLAVLLARLPGDTGWVHLALPQYSPGTLFPPSGKSSLEKAMGISSSDTARWAPANHADAVCGSVAPLCVTVTLSVSLSLFLSLCLPLSLAPSSLSAPGRPCGLLPPPPPPRLRPVYCLCLPWLSAHARALCSPCVAIVGRSPCQWVPRSRTGPPPPSRVWLSGTVSPAVASGCSGRQGGRSAPHLACRSLE
jgi:hypothetical protein